MTADGGDLRHVGELATKNALRHAGIPTVTTVLAQGRDDAVRIAGELGYPVAFKIASPDIVHKSDVGGVRLGIGTPSEASARYDELLSEVERRAPHARIEGVTVQSMAPPGGLELVIGARQDPQFGPVVMFGLGGVLVEVLADVTLGVAPLTTHDCTEMVRRIKGFPLLTGYRGRPAANVREIEKLIMKVSDFVVGRPDLEELDLNPLLAYPDGNLVVDARMSVRAHSSDPVKETIDG
jgi:succinyl-CoA synthetase beta subunit